jgi:iron complex transport system substrate-binding protein
MVLLLSSMVGAAGRGQKLVDDLQRNLDTVREAARRLSRRPRVYFEEWDDPMISGIRWVSELVEIAGGKDVFSDLSRSQAAKGRIVAPDAVVEKAPDIMIASWCGKKFRPERVRSRAGWESVPAVRDDELHEVKSAEILQPGPAALTDGLGRLHTIISAWAAKAGAP